MINPDILMRAFRLMCMTNAMDQTYESRRQLCQYVHSTSRGHEAIQLAAAFQLLPCDYVSPYYRDEALLLGLGFSPYELMLQLLAKKDDIFSAGRQYYAHPSYRGADKPQIIHQSSATGMQVIPSTGIAQGLQYLQQTDNPLYRRGPQGEAPIVICSMGDGSVTEGEVSEAWQFAILKKLPIIFLVQDNNWGISARGSETRAMDACDYAAGFPGLERVRIDGTDFEQCFDTMRRVTHWVRQHQSPYLVQAAVPLLSHHTSGVRSEFYRSQEEWKSDWQRDPFARLKNRLQQNGVTENELATIEEEIKISIEQQFEQALAAPDPDPQTVAEHVFAPTAIQEEQGTRAPANGKKIVMVDAALYAIREIMEDYPEALLFGQDVGRRLGGVFREAATLAGQFGDYRVFNTAIQEAYIIGSTAGLSATGVKPIVEIQFGDYIYPGLNQLVCEISKSCYLSAGKFPVQTLIRIPVGAYGGGGPYHSGSIESTLLSIKGIKIAYPSNAADMKGLMKAAFLDPNPVIMLEHKGLYWSKVPGTEEAKQTEPDRDYVLPLGKANVLQQADAQKIDAGESCCIITYGMGVYWARAASVHFPGAVEIVDLRSLFPLDEELLYDSVKEHGKCIVLTEEQQSHSFAESLAGRISHACFSWLDAPIEVMGAMDLPAVPIHIVLEKAMLPGAEKLRNLIGKLLAW